MGNSLFKLLNPKHKTLLDTLQGIIEKTFWKDKVFIVGGFVRDAILGREINDINIVVDGDRCAQGFAEWFAIRNGDFSNSQNPRYVGNGVYQYTFSNGELAGIELLITDTHRSKFSPSSTVSIRVPCTIQEDARERDTTINALYYDVTSGGIKTFGGNGILDLCGHIIRATVSTDAEIDAQFNNDPLRMMRIIRLSAQLKWGIDKTTWLGIVRNAHLIENVPYSRVCAELNKILLTDHPSFGIQKIFYAGLFSYFIQDVADLNKVLECKAPLTTVFEQTMNVLDYTQPILEHRLAALFHGIGKIVTEDENFFCHNVVGAECADADLKLLGYSLDIRREVKKAIECYLLFDNFKNNDNPSIHKVRHFIEQCGEVNVLATLDLMHAYNCNKVYNRKPDLVPAIVKKIEEINSKDKKENAKKTSTLPVDGYGIMKAFNLKPSALIGTLMGYVRQFCQTNPSATKEECLEEVKKHIPAEVQTGT